MSRHRISHTAVVPELLTLDDWGFPTVDSRSIDGETLLHHAQRAVATCPRLALLIEEFRTDRG